MSPLLKYQSETENERKATRSRFRSDSSRRRSARPSRKTRQKPPQIHGSLILSPPNAPLYPRAIFHATCGPVHASSTAPLWSSTRPVAISPAAPHQIFTVQQPCSVPALHLVGSGEYVTSVIRPLRGYRASQSAILSLRSNSAS